MVDMIIQDPVGAAKAIYVFIATIIGCVVGGVIVVKKIVELVKQGKLHDVLDIILDFIVQSEEFKTADGATKKEIVLSKVRNYCADNHVKYNEAIVTGALERYIDYSKTVNAREKDINNEQEDNTETNEII